jgi:hypothetical protein
MRPCLLSWVSDLSSEVARVFLLVCVACGLCRLPATITTLMLLLLQVPTRAASV